MSKKLKKIGENSKATNVGRGESAEQETQDEEANRCCLAYYVEKHVSQHVRNMIRDLSILRSQIQNDLYVPASITDEQLILYLFAKSNDVPETVSLLLSNYKFRASHPQIYSSRSVADTDLQQVWNVLRVGVFPKRTIDNQHFVLIGLRDPDSSKFKAMDALKLFLMCADVYYILQGLPNSVQVILDAKDVNQSFITRQNYHCFRIAINYLQESLPYNVAGIHVINSTVIVRAVYRLIRPFLTKDTVEAIHFYNNSNLKSVFPPKYLPSESEGTALESTIDEYQDRFRSQFEQLQEFFDTEEEQRLTHNSKMRTTSTI